MPTAPTSEEDRMLPIEPSGRRGLHLFRMFWALKFGFCGLCIAGLAIAEWGRDRIRGAAILLSLAIAILCTGRLFALANRTAEPSDDTPWQPPPDP